MWQGPTLLLRLCAVLSPMGSLLIIRIRDSLSLLSSVSKIEFCCPWECWQFQWGFQGDMVEFMEGFQCWECHYVWNDCEMWLCCRINLDYYRLLKTYRKVIIVLFRHLQFCTIHLCRWQKHSLKWLHTITILNGSVNHANGMMQRWKRWRCCNMSLCHLVLHATRWPNKCDILSWFLKTWPRFSVVSQ